MILRHSMQITCPDGDGNACLGMGEREPAVATRRRTVKVSVKQKFLAGPDWPRKDIVDET
jgi:hypothetical protein